MKISEVQQMIEEEKDLPPDMPRSSANKNSLNLKPSSFTKACKISGLHPYKLLVTPRGRIDGREHEARLEFCQYIADQSDEFFKRLIISDEKMFTWVNYVFSPLLWLF